MDAPGPGERYGVRIIHERIGVWFDEAQFNDRVSAARERVERRMAEAMNQLHDRGERVADAHVKIDGDFVIGQIIAIVPQPPAS